MDFTREPIIETVITPKEGSTLAVRSSKGTGQEEYFVDAVEVVSFGSALFFRSLERPKSFLLPVSDYEILEVRETRLVLKNVGLDRSIKIAGGREAALRTTSRAPQEKGEIAQQAVPEVSSPQTTTAEQPDGGEAAKAEVKLDKKRDRRRNYKRKKGRDELQDDGSVKEGAEVPPGSNGLQPSQAGSEAAVKIVPEVGAPMPAVFSSLLPPPSTLISETIARYKDNALFRGAFFIKEQETGLEQQRPLDAPSEDVAIEKPLLAVPHDDDDRIELPSISLDLPAYIPPEMSEEETERVYQERQALRLGRRGNNRNDDSNQKDDIPLDLDENASTEETPYERIIPEEEMMQEESEGFADNLDVDLRQDQKDNDSEDKPQAHLSDDSSNDDRKHLDE